MTTITEFKEAFTFRSLGLITFGITGTLLFSCGPRPSENSETAEGTTTEQTDTLQAISDPLVSDIYTADPSAHVFNGRIYIYPSHDIESGVE